jgi:hypothetical protein
VAQHGSGEQQQEAITETKSWLDNHPDNGTVREKYLALIGRTSKDSIATESLILHQWQWMINQQKLDQSLWNSFLPALYHNVSPNSELCKAAIHLALKDYPDDPIIIGQVFGYFREYLDYTTCYDLATKISQSKLPIDKWQNYIYPANFFRDYGDFQTAERIYYQTIKAAKNKVKKFPNLQKTIDFANLSHAQLLLLTNPPYPDESLSKLRPILNRNAKHAYAHLLMAQSYQAKGSSFYIKAKSHFEKAIQFDLEKRGFFYYEFGRIAASGLGISLARTVGFEFSLERAFRT